MIFSSKIQFDKLADASFWTLLPKNSIVRVWSTPVDFYFSAKNLDFHFISVYSKHQIFGPGRHWLIPLRFSFRHVFQQAPDRGYPEN